MSYSFLYSLGVSVSIVACFFSLSPFATCSSCGESQLYLAGFSLSFIGALVYLTLLLVGLLNFNSRWLLYGIAIVVGSHIAILSSFINQECLNCKIAFSGVVLSLVVACLSRIKYWWHSVIYICASVVLTSMAIHLTHFLVMESPKVRKIVDDLNSDPTFDRNYINVVAYESNTCSLCRAFNSEYEPRLSRDANRPIRFYHKTSTSVTAFPTIIIVGRTNDVFIGLPPYDKLLGDINRY